MAGVHQQPEQSNFLAEGQIITCKLKLLEPPRGPIIVVAKCCTIVPASLPRRSINGRERKIIDEKEYTT